MPRSPWPGRSREAGFAAALLLASSAFPLPARAEAPDSAAVTAAPPAWAADGWWPATPPDDAWEPSALLLLPTGGMVVADRAKPRLFLLAGADAPPRRLPAPDRSVVEWTALAPAVGLSFLALDGPGRAVHQFDYAGNYLGLAADLDDIASDEGLGPLDPAGLAVDRSGRVVISDRAGDRLLVFSSDWRLTGVWGETGEGNGQWRRPGAVAVGSHAPFLVSDEGNRRLVLLDELGNVLATGAVPAPARGVAVLGEERYAASDETGVTLLDGDLFPIARTPLLPVTTCDGAVWATSALAGGRGRVFVGEGCTGRILGLVPAGD